MTNNWYLFVSIDTNIYRNLNIISLKIFIKNEHYYRSGDTNINLSMFSLVIDMQPVTKVFVHLKRKLFKNEDSG